MDKVETSPSLPDTEAYFDRIRGLESGKGPGLSKKEILILFRFLIFAIVLIFSFFNVKERSALLDLKIILLALVYCGTLGAMFFLKQRWFEDNKLLPVFFVVDTIFIVSGIYMAGIAETDLSIIFFMTVFISALSQDVRSVFSVATVSCAIYAFLHYRATGELWSSDTLYIVRFPFLFVAAAMSGYMAVETKKNKEEREQLATMNRFLAERADLSTSKLFEINQELKSILEYNDCVLASLKMGIIVAGKDGRITTFNSGAGQITGLGDMKITHKILEDLPETLKPVAAALRRTLEEEKGFVQDNLELRTPRSEIVPVTLETSLLRNSAHEIMGAIATFRDMTLLKQMENQILRSERLSALGEMAAGVAHEIKNPLNSVLGFSRRLSENLQEPKMKKYADIIADEVHRIDAIVNDVLEYSRPDKVHRSPGDIHRLMDDVAVFIGDKAEKAGVLLEKRYAEEFPLIPFDEPKMRQVLLNLMLNAIQAMESGGKLTLQTELIDGLAPESKGPQSEADVFQQLFLRQKMASISVRDTGSGISKENLSKLFHPFFTTKITGTGLGLSICHKIVASHGGTLGVESEVGKGSVFTILLPID